MIKFSNCIPLGMSKTVMCLIFFITMLSASVLFPACRDNEWDERRQLSEKETGGSLLEAIRENPECSQFYQAVVKAGYGDLLSQANNFTVFVPQNSAWQGVDMNDETLLKNIVAYHIAYGRLLSTDPAFREPVRMVNTKVVRYSDETQTFNGSKITSADHPAGNGVYHLTDKIMELKKNVWEYIAGMTAYEQVNYINMLNHKEMDLEKSIQTGINAMGRPVYDTAWINVNDFLKVVPLDNEMAELTYFVVKNEGFNLLYNKYRKFFTCATVAATDSLTRFNVCQDFVFNGIADITRFDTLTNAFGVKVPVKNVIVAESYDASNGRVYLIDQSNILLREKIRPVLIEGEDFIRSASPNNVFVRFKRWASGERDMMLSCSYFQADTVRDEQGQFVDRLTRTFQWNSAINANVVNCNVEYKASVYSADYEIHYLSYDDIEDHYSRPLQTYRIEQKLFVSMPGRPVLRRGDAPYLNQVFNNYLGNYRCFVSQDTAGIYKERVMKQWMLTDPNIFVSDNVREDPNQLLKRPVNDPRAAVMEVDRTGELTIWLCNTARTIAANAQGMLFLDYIRLVPILDEE